MCGVFLQGNVSRLSEEVCPKLHMEKQKLNVQKIMLDFSQSPVVISSVEFKMIFSPSFHLQRKNTGWDSMLANLTVILTKKE